MTTKYFRTALSAAFLTIAVGTVYPGTTYASPDSEAADLDSDEKCHPRKFTNLQHVGGRERFTFECKSSDSCLKRCRPEAPNGRRIRDIRLVKQTSEAECKEASSWGFEGFDTVWVDYDCEGVFEAFTN